MMKTFDDIYNSVKSNFEPQTRNAIDIRTILSKAYEILQNDKYVDFSPFEKSDSAFDIDRTTVERLIYELKEIKFEDNGQFVFKSEGVERVIADIKTLEILAINPSVDTEIYKSIDFGILNASMLYLIEVARQAIINSKQKLVLDNLAKYKDRSKKLEYLNSIKFDIKQRERFWDKKVFDSVVYFIELELKKWEKIAEIDVDNEISSTQELHDYIVKLLKEKLEHSIRYLEGYRVFWRDELCIETPKKENEIHHFIKSILKPECDKMKIKISRESVVANGKIDITFSYLNFTVCLEVKKAQHQDITSAINTQLTEYMVGEETEYGIYLILWYKSLNGYKLPKDYQDLNELIGNIEIDNDKFKYEIVGIDCSKPIYPSRKS